MNTALRHRRLAAWLALAAMLWLALAPTLVHALAADRDTLPWATLCSADGPKPAPGEPAGDTALHGGHCPLCSAQPALPPAPPAAWVLAADARAHEPPWLFLHAPRTLHAWRLASPRGPPAFA